ncbi:hypothetical protein [Caulobacter sp. B11]|uniref:hypothetical protein n=1 Tax=Caulobacter sp. B11 TaxID=2048899 RepID=UPI003516E3F0
MADPLLGPGLAGQAEGVGIVVHAMQGDDHLTGLAVARQPAHQAQPRAIEADQPVVLESRPAKAERRQAGSLDHRRAGRQARDRGGGDKQGAA